MENDYNQLEIDNAISELLDVHCNKLKAEEFNFIEELSNQEKITQEERNILMALYDNMAEPGY